MQSCMPSCLNALACGLSGASAARASGAEIAIDTSTATAMPVRERPSMVRVLLWGGRVIFRRRRRFASVNDPTSLKFPGGRDGFRLFHAERQPLPRQHAQRRGAYRTDLRAGAVGGDGRAQLGM